MLCQQFQNATSKFVKSDLTRSEAGTTTPTLTRRCSCCGRLRKSNRIFLIFISPIYIRIYQAKVYAILYIYVLSPICSKSQHYCRYGIGLSWGDLIILAGNTAIGEDTSIQSVTFVKILIRMNVRIYSYQQNYTNEYQNIFILIF